MFYPFLMNMIPRVAFLSAFSAALWLVATPAKCQSGGDYQIFVSNEKGGTVTVINGADFKVTDTILVGKRPRGVHASPDGKTVYVAVSGTPIEPPPKLDANGNPIFLKGHDDDDDDKAKSDKSADGIALVDIAQKKFLRKIPAGSDPEQFCLSADGKRLFISNEDTGTATVLDASNGKVITFVPVSREPEGVGVRPDGKVFYVTCETAGDVFAIDAEAYKVVGQIRVGLRPRSIVFLPDSSRGFVPSESAGELNLIDTVNQKLLKTVALPKGSRPQCLQVSSDGKKVYAGCGRSGTVCVVDANTLATLNSIKVGTRPWGIALSPDGKYLFSANGPSDDVSVVDLATEKEVLKIKSPGSPWGVTVVPNAK
ncbi:MAG TPA: beta-propeller fold lactonase family protein [Verrucomicrobiae bacterium]|jgi:YVTN family beta-propeller protein|nr:beta-propeller fold lactonase family protein [Verrucomicrobiae bacterium]